MPKEKSSATKTKNDGKEKMGILEGVYSTILDLRAAELVSDETVCAFWGYLREDQKVKSNSEITSRQSSFKPQKKSESPPRR